jgi:hypothetical protein
MLVTSSRILEEQISNLSGPPDRSRTQLLSPVEIDDGVDNKGTIRKLKYVLGVLSAGCL